MDELKSKILGKKPAGQVGCLTISSDGILVEVDAGTVSRGGGLEGKVARGLDVCMKEDSSGLSVRWDISTPSSKHEFDVSLAAEMGWRGKAVFRGSGKISVLESGHKRIQRLKRKLLSRQFKCRITSSSHPAWVECLMSI